MTFGNYKKIIIIVLSLFCLTGCSIDYDVVIDSRGVVTEIVTIKEDNSVMEAINPSVENFIKNYYNVYASNTKLTEYTKEEIFESNESGYIFTRIYSSIELYAANSYFLNNAYNDVVYNIESNIVTISGGTFIGYNYFLNTINNVPENIKEITASIEIPYFMISNTAHKSDAMIYSYLYNKENKDNELLFEFDISKSYKKQSLFNLSGEYFILGMYAMIILVILIGVIYFNNKNNKI